MWGEVLLGQKALFHKAVSGGTSAFLEDEQLIPPADSSRGIVCSPLKSKAKVRRTRKGSKLSWNAIGDGYGFPTLEIDSIIFDIYSQLYRKEEKLRINKY